MGMFDGVTIFQQCPACKNWASMALQTKDLENVMFNYYPLPEDWFTNQNEGLGGQKKLREKLPVSPKFPKDKENAVWKNQAEKTEAQASLNEPYASQLKFIHLHGNCPKCNTWLEGKLKVEGGFLIGNLFDISSDESYLMTETHREEKNS